MADRVITETTSVIGGALRRISWGAVFAGVIVAIMVSLVLNLLGLGIGLTAIQATDQAAGAGFGIGAAIWWTISSLAALFAGGWVAGHLAGAPTRTDATLHGVLTWGVTTLVTLLFFTTTVGGLLGGAANALSNMPQAQQQLRETGRQILDPAGAGSSESQRAVQEIKQEGRQMVQQQQAQRELERALDRLFAGGSAAQQNERENVIGVLAQHGVDRSQAEQTVDNWINRFESTTTQTEAAGAEPGAMRETGEAVTQGLTAAAWWGFIGLVLGALAAAYGGRYAARRYFTTVTHAGPGAPGTV